ncbi:hypothetical protein SAMN05444166_0266 [Singulisphaera sp. GP187]|uniref:hypothetical protein n=1 Tax=Singulisphaera sp. GP187 TaxID=1882752 RepID=UPI00092AE95F|nr:hypothetical protein [Singulisphaera sp. GP187]SIN70465.1 hypothetical protein SAMN05444166_0266 [Singulisphaera sp. GP187]
MPSLEAMILRAMFAAHHNTLEQVRALAPDRDSASAVAARHGHLVAQRDLFRALHEFTPGHRLTFRDGRGVAADSEGGIHWRMGTRRLVTGRLFSAS